MDNNISTLNSCQTKAYNTFQAFINDPQSREMILAGSAGTGKTYLTDELIKSSSMPVILSAPTHKAVKVLKLVNPDLTTMTVHKIMKVKMVLDMDTGKQIPKVSDESVGEPDKLLIIDESSMLDNDMLSIIRQSGFSKILYIGDSYQLPPINYVHSPVFDGRVEYQAELLTVMRGYEQSLAIKFRDAQDSGERVTCGGDPDVFLDTYNPNTDVILCYKNDTVIRYNKQIRCSLGRTDDYEIGEKLVANDAIVAFGDVLIENNTEMRVVDNFDGVYGGIRGQVVELEFIDDEVDFSEEMVLKAKAMSATKKFNNGEIDRETKTSAWREFFSYCNNYCNYIDPMKEVTPAVLNYVIMVADDSDELVLELKKRFSKALDFRNFVRNCKQSGIVLPDIVKVDRSKAWNDYYELKAKFADFRPPFACTVHKSQGSTIENVFIDVDDIRGSNIINKLMYVAVTRASNNTILKGYL